MKHATIIVCAVLLSACATCREQPTECAISIGAPLLIGAIAIAASSHGSHHAAPTWTLRTTPGPEIRP